MSRAGPTPHRSLPAAALLLVAVLGTRTSVAAPPTISPIPDQTVLEGWSITYQVLASDPDGNPLTYFVSGPSWVSISSTGLLTMAPPGGSADPGGSILDATVTVSDGTTPVSDSFDIRVLDVRADQTEHGGVVVYSLKSWSSSGVTEGGLNLYARDLPTPVPQGRIVRDKGFGFVTFETGESDRPIVLGRIYNSTLERDQIVHGHFGRNWLGTFDWRIQINGSIVDVTTNRGGKIRFQSPAAGVWNLAAPSDVPHRLAQVGTAFLFFDAATGWVQRFDAATGRLMSSEDTHGNVLTMAYAGSLLTSVTDPFGRMLSFTYDRTGRVAQVSDGTRSVSYSYDVAGNLITFTDAAGGVTHYVYSSGSPAGLLVQVIEPAGNTPWTFSYGSKGEVLSIVDAAANTSALSYTHDPSGRATMVQLVRPVPGGYTYRNNLDGRCIEVTDPAGGITSRAFDTAGRLSSLTRPLGDVTSFSYDPTSGWPASVGFADASSMEFAYGSRLYVGNLSIYQVSSITRPDGTSLSYTYDAPGNLTGLTEPGAVTWSWTYNAFGRPTTFRNPAGGTTSYAYDAMNRLVTRTDHFGNATQYAYDALDRVTQVTDPGAPARTYTYDALDRMLSTTNELGKTWSYQSDANGRLLQITNPTMGAHHFVWNTMDRLIRTDSPLGGQTSYTYDALGRIATVSDPTSRVTTYEYDDVARLCRVRDPSGQAVTYTYDANGRTTGCSDPLSQTTHYTYDAVDRMTTLADPVGTTFTYTYDAMDRLQTITGPLGYLRDYDYDARGLLIRSAFGGAAEEYMRTPLGEIGSILDRNGETWRYTYDAEGRGTSSADPLGRTTQYTYDSRWNLNQITSPAGTASFTYDAASRLIQRSYSDGTVIPYSYDDLGRLLTTTGASFTYDADGRVTTSAGGIGYGYDAAGRLTSLSYASGKTVNYTYDARGNLATAVDWVGGTTGFTYDAAGRRTRLARPDGSVTSYVYDAADRLTRLADIRTDSTASVSLAYDALDRVTSAARRQPLQPTFSNENATYAYDAAGQIVGYSYDGLGRLLSDGVVSFEWDVASRLKTATGAAGPLRFEYDGLGRVTRRTLGAEVEDDVHGAWSGKYLVPGVTHKAGRMHGELYLRWSGAQAAGDGWYRSKPHVAPDPIVLGGTGTLGSFSGTLDYVLKSSSPSVNYVRAPSGELLHSVDDGTGARRFYHFDDRGNTIFLSNDAGSAITSYAYSATGSSVDEIGIGDPHLGRYTYRAQLGAREEGGVGLLYRGEGGMFFGKGTRAILPPPGPHGQIGGVDYTITGHRGEASVYSDPPWRYKATTSQVGPDGVVILYSSLPGGGSVPSDDNWAVFARNWGNEGSGMQLYFTGKLKPAEEALISIAHSDPAPTGPDYGRWGNPQYITRSSTGIFAPYVPMLAAAKGVVGVHATSPIAGHVNWYPNASAGDGYLDLKAQMKQEAMHPIWSLAIHVKDDPLVDHPDFLWSPVGGP